MVIARGARWSARSCQRSPTADAANLRRASARPSRSGPAVGLDHAPRPGDRAGAAPRPRRRARARTAPELPPVVRLHEGVQAHPAAGAAHEIEAPGRALGEHHVGQCVLAQGSRGCSASARAAPGLGPAAAGWAIVPWAKAAMPCNLGHLGRRGQRRQHDAQHARAVAAVEQVVLGELDAGQIARAACSGSSDGLVEVTAHPGGDGGDERCSRALAPVGPGQRAPDEGAACRRTSGDSADMCSAARPLAPGRCRRDRRAATRWPRARMMKPPTKSSYSGRLDGRPTRPAGPGCRTAHGRQRFRRPAAPARGAADRGCARRRVRPPKQRRGRRIAGRRSRGDRQAPRRFQPQLMLAAGCSDML